ncbi:MAG TPA: class I SAM-dependent methyltransferase [Candidatus Acidoferrum sp.]|nr:class I SAM-dependent methyltransferase [Candidatus Acidoferrum sp.]
MAQQVPIVPSSSPPSPVSVAPASLAMGAPGSPAEYWEQRLTKLGGLDGVGFIGFGLAYNEWMYRVRKRIFLKHIRSVAFDPSTAQVLDVGSGTGFWVEVWKSLGVKKLTASDITVVASERLREKYPEYRVLRMDITSPEAGAPGQQYDLISAIDVLFHIVDDGGFSRTFTNVGRLLKPGGFFLFSENLPHRAIPHSVTQVNRSLESVSAEVAGAGMRIVKRVPMFVVMNAPVDVRSAFLLRLWKLFMAPLQHFPVLGNAYGAALFPLECLLLEIFREGPSTELVICQKV